MYQNIKAFSSETQQSYLIGERLGKGSYGFVFECKNADESVKDSLVIKITKKNGLN